MSRALLLLALRCVVVFVLCDSGGRSMGRCTSRGAGQAEEEAGGPRPGAEAPSASCSGLRSTPATPEEAQARCREPATAQAPSRSAPCCIYDDPRIDYEEDQAPHQPEIGPGSHREQRCYSLIHYEHYKSTFTFHDSAICGRCRFCGIPTTFDRDPVIGSF